MLQDVAIKLGESSMESGGLFSKEKHKDGSIIDERFSPDFVKTLSKVFIRSKRFSQPQYSFLDAYFHLVLKGLIAEPLHLVKPIKFDGLELVIKNPHNLFLGEASKVEADDSNFRETIIYDFVLFYFFFFWSL